MESSSLAEIQGALVDGIAGVVTAKPDKVLKYLGLAWEIAQRGWVSQHVSIENLYFLFTNLLKSLLLLHFSFETPTILALAC